MLPHARYSVGGSTAGGSESHTVDGVDEDREAPCEQQIEEQIEHSARVGMRAPLVVGGALLRMADQPRRVGRHDERVGQEGRRDEEADRRLVDFGQPEERALLQGLRGGA